MAAFAADFASITAPAVFIPAPPARLAPFQQRAIVYSGELAIANGLRLIARGTCKVHGHEGAPVFIVSSASRPGRSHFVWVEHGRIYCRCEQRSLRHALTCSHAQFVRLLIVAEHAAAASSPAAIAPAPEPEPTPPTSGGPSGSGPRRPTCPTCGGPADAEEIEQLGECLQCLQMRADYARDEEARLAVWVAEESRRIAEQQAQEIPCWACGEPATVETDNGMYCATCASLSAPARACAARDRQAHLNADRRQQKRAEMNRRIQSREKAREKAGIPSAASPRAARRAKSAKTTAATAD